MGMAEVAEVAERHGGLLADMNEERYCRHGFSEARSPGLITLSRMRIVWRKDGGYGGKSVTYPPSLKKE